MNKELIKISKFLSLVLRHKPEAIGLILDGQGWAILDELIACAARKGKHLTRPLIQQVVSVNDKKRFSLNEDGSRIRAVQGHSIQVNLGLEPQQPPEMLFHGTATQSLASIRSRGLIPGARQHVHLSLNEATSRKVGQRHGRPVVLRIRAGQMWRNGIPFFCSENGVWLTDTVPPEFIDFP